MLRTSLVALLVLACGCSPTWWGRAPTRWDRTAFERDQAVRVLGCAELGFSLDRETSLTTDHSFLLDVSLRNRCVREVGVDLTALRITGHDESGAVRPITIYDPRREMHPYQLDAEAEGTERLRIDVDSFDATRTICIDVSRISPEANLAAPAPICLFAPVPSDVTVIDEER